MEREERKIKHVPPAVYQLQHGTEPVIMVLFKQGTGKDFYTLNSDSKLRFLPLLG